jgi:hypothetical protein
MAVFLPLALGWAAGASAIPMTRSFEFEAVDLRSQIFDQGVFDVTDPVFGTVTVVIDPDGAAVMDVMALSGFVNVTSGGPVGYNYLPDIDELVVGGLGSGVDGSDIADFRLVIGNASTLLPTFLFLSYNESREFWIAGSGRVTLVGIPEPGTAGLFGLAMLTLTLLYGYAFTAGRRAPVRRL